ncbi:hypothetical protein [Streptomyces kanasensis]|uniref:Uncharacterized protein n=1 Tax=Streptomyces kanasensis TaxID=936756 RepID=A0A124EC04_9ACTN|nr:hypothetical protein [Streptomyces kanasensis]KUH36112.1 hypothetical protein ATE80_25335 [Streptomyces kanasensis]
MRTSVRRSIQALLDAIDTITLWAGAAAGAVTGYAYYPVGFDADWRLPAAGAIALSSAFTLSMALDAALAPVRRRAYGITPPASTDTGIPDGLDEALDQIAAAAEDAAHRAAQHDRPQRRPAPRRRPVARLHHRRGHLLPRPGTVLHYSRGENERGIAEHHYTLLTAGDSTPVPITNVRQNHEDLLHTRKTAEAADAVVPSTV